MTTNSAVLRNGFNVDATATGLFVSVRLWCYQEALDSGEVAW